MRIRSSLGFTKENRFVFCGHLQFRQKFKFFDNQMGKDDLIVRNSKLLPYYDSRRASLVVREALLTVAGT